MKSEKQAVETRCFYLFSQLTYIFSSDPLSVKGSISPMLVDNRLIRMNMRNDTFNVTE
jgi:hypothetical protein